MSPERAFQAALKALIEPAVSPVKVLDLVRSGEAAPYITFEDVAAVRVDEVACAQTMQIAQRVVVYSRSGSRAEALDLMDAVRVALEGEQPALSNGYTLNGPLQWRRAGTARTRVGQIVVGFCDIEAHLSLP